MGMLQIIDDESVLFDFDDPSGAANPHGLKTRIDDLDIGSVESEETTFAPGRPGLQIASRTPRLATMSWLMRVDPYASVDEGIAGVRELGRLLEAGGVMLYQPNGATQRRFIDYLPASSRPLIRGQPRGLRKILTLLQDPDGAGFEVRRQPFLRGDELDSAVNKLVNPTLLLDSNGNGVPDGWTALGTPTGPGIDATDNALEFTADAAGEGYYQETAAVPGEVWSAQAETVVGSGTRDARVMLSFRSAVAELAAVQVDSSATTYGRRTVTSAAAPAGTTLVRINLICGAAGSGSGVLGFRLAQLEKASAATLWVPGEQTVEYDPAVSGGRAMPLYAHGDAPTFPRLHFTADADGGSLYRARLGLFRGSHVADWLNTRKFLQAEACTPGTDTSAVNEGGGASGSGNNAMRTTFTTNNNLVTRLSATMSTLLDCYRGHRIRVFARVAQNSTPQQATFDLRLWSSLGGPSSEAEDHPTVRLDTTKSNLPISGTDEYWCDVPLGDIEVPDEVPHELKLWFDARRVVGGTGLDLNWDFFSFVPIDEGLPRIAAGLKILTVDSGKELVYDTATGEVYVLVTASGKQYARGRIEGRSFALAPQEFQALYGVRLNFEDTPTHGFDDTPFLVQGLKARVVYAPLYNQ